jgi:hypothetical protein
MKQTVPHLYEGAPDSPRSKEKIETSRLMSAFWWDPVGTEARPIGKGRDLGQWGGPPCSPPLNLHQLPDMSPKIF